MVEAGPVGDPHVVRYTFTYTVSDPWIEDRMDIDGVAMPKQWSIAFGLGELPNPGERQRARKLWNLYQQFGGTAELDAPTDDPIEFLNSLDEWIAVEKERIEYEDHQRQQAEVERERFVQDFEEEMKRWIQAHGSERMKAAQARGYKVTGSYARARACKEIPGAWVDTSGRAEYRERVDPSKEALELESAFETFMEVHDCSFRTRIVWLVEPPTDLAEAYEEIDVDEVLAGEVDEWEFQQQEALLISGYLGRYEAFLMIDQDLRAPIEEQEAD